MQKRKWLLPALALLTFVLMFGCADAVGAVYGHTQFLAGAAPPNPTPDSPGQPPSAQTPAASSPGSNSHLSPSFVAQDGTVHLVALGDSLTRGVGDVSGNGYIGHVRQALMKQTQKPVVFTNLAVSGETSAELDAGFDTEEEKSIVRGASLIMFTIGGNDLFGATGQLENISAATIQISRKGFETHLGSILTKLRKLNPNCPIYLIGIYNPFYGLLDPQIHADQYVYDFNRSMLVYTSRYSNFHVVSIYDLFERNTDNWLSGDHFHPNEKAYERIAARVLQDLDIPM